MINKPRALKSGATLGFVAPSGAYADAAMLPRAVHIAQEMGYKVKIGKSCGARYGYLSGEDALRAQDLNDMFADEQVDAVVCIRGGYGTMRILDRLDYDLARKHPKLLMGYSDITALHAAYFKYANLATLHAPMPVSDWASGSLDELSRESLEQALRGELPAGFCNPPGLEPVTICPGRCEGELVGGNLTLVASLQGTPYAPDLDGRILLLEDVDEYDYRIDRLLTQLRLTGAFKRLSGVVLGGFTNVPAKYPDRALPLEQIFRDVFSGAGIPVLANLAIGHCLPRLSVMLGVRYVLDADRGLLKRAESCFCQ